MLTLPAEHLLPVLITLRTLHQDQLCLEDVFHSNNHYSKKNKYMKQPLKQTFTHDVED